MSIQYGVCLEIVKAEVVSDYTIKLEFSDGHKNTINFEPFISENPNESIHQFLDRRKFNSFRLDWGNLVWGDFEMCFPIEDLYSGSVIKHARLAVAEDSAKF